MLCKNDSLYIGHTNGHISIINTTDWQVERTFSAHEPKEVLSLQCDEGLLSTGGNDAAVRLWTLPDIPRDTLYLPSAAILPLDDLAGWDR